MKYTKLLMAGMIFLCSCKPVGDYVEISKEVMEDKVKGAWAGKMIGVMYGRPMEFTATSGMYLDSIHWKPENLQAYLKKMRFL